MKNLSENKKILLHTIGFMIGLLIGAFVIFQIFFLIRVIPHGGI